MLAAVHDRLALGDQAGEHERGAGPHVGGGHRRTREPLHPADDRVPALGADVGAHPHELVDELEAAVVDVLGRDRAALRHRHERHRDRHEVGGETGMRKGRDVDRAQPADRSGPQPVGGLRHAHAHLAQLATRRSRGARGRVPTSSISPPAMPHAMRSVPASTRSAMISLSAGTSSSTPSISIVDEPAPITCAPMRSRNAARSVDLGLARRVLDHGRALGEHRRAHQVLGRADARELQQHTRTVQRVALRAARTRA